MCDIAKHLHIYDTELRVSLSSGEEIRVDVGAQGIEKLKWLADTDTDVTFRYTTAEWDIFFGPYIDGAETGYIFQFINLYTRKVYSVQMSFSSERNIATVRQYLKSELR